MTNIQINRITRDDVEQFAHAITEPEQDFLNALDRYQKIATQSAIYPGQGTPLGLVYVALKGAGEAGEFAEHVGKAMRDDLMLDVTTDDPRDENGPRELTVEAFELTADRKDALVKEIGDQLWYLSAKCNELGIKLSHAALVNLEKLLDRTERNALQGSGDTR